MDSETKEALGGCLSAVMIAVGAIIVIVLLLGIGIGVYGLGVWLVWNYALVPLVGVEPLSFWISCLIGLGLSIVSAIVRGKSRKRD